MIAMLSDSQSFNWKFGFISQPEIAHFSEPYQRSRLYKYLYLHRNMSIHNWRFRFDKMNLGQGKLDKRLGHICLAPFHLFCIQQTKISDLKLCAFIDFSVRSIKLERNLTSRYCENLESAPMIVVLVQSWYPSVPEHLNSFWITFHAAATGL